MSAATTENVPAVRSGGGNGKMTTIKSLFEAAKGKMAAVAPKHMSPDRMMRVALLTISKTPALARCTPHSLLNAFMTATQLGLELGGTLGEAYLVPYKDEATFILGYRGMINLARRSGHIQSIEAQVVRAGDEFEFEYGIQCKFRHKPIGAPDRDITHAWALARFKDGGYQLDVQTIDEVNAIRRRSRASNNGPWVTDFAEMAKKTAVRRLCKYLPLSPEERDAIEVSDRGEFGDTLDIDGRVADAERRKKSDRLADALGEDEQLPPEPVGEAVDADAQAQPQ